MFTRTRLRTDQNGMLLLVLIITIPFLILIATYYLRESLTSYQVGRQDQLRTEAQLAIDAGADYGVEQISQNNAWTGTGGEMTLHSDSSLKTTFAITVNTNSSTSKTMIVTGRTYWPANTTLPRQQLTVYVDLQAVTGGNYSIVTGEGGLTMSNNSKVVAGDVLVNGTISLSNSAQIGLSTNPVTVKVADQACPQPPDSTYPQVCASGVGAQPISISNVAHIYGTVDATNQTSGTGMSNPGLQAGSNPPPQTLPTYNRAAQKSAVTTTETGTVASCSSGTATWPANLEITGNVTVSGSCHVTVMGNVWITGNLNLSNSAQLIVSSTLGTTVPNIMVDGSSGVVLSNNSSLVPNSNNTGFEIYTFWSAADCSPDCSSVTGTDLYNSRNITTISLGNNVSAADTILYAYWSQVTMSNSGQIGALLGQTVNLSNNGTITFGSSVNSGESVITWVIHGYRRH
ncbi:MAG TPA: hypothetical protein VFN56_02025 [Candidatus Saccharimonadales bacterium]|nr:hypothetical protein [Candidatus Saccharimonadales bacterium]